MASCLFYSKLSHIRAEPKIARHQKINLDQLPLQQSNIRLEILHLVSNIENTLPKTNMTGWKIHHE